MLSGEPSENPSPTRSRRRCRPTLPGVIDNRLRSTEVRNGEIRGTDTYAVRFGCNIPSGGCVASTSRENTIIPGFVEGERDGGANNRLIVSSSRVANGAAQLADPDVHLAVACLGRSRPRRAVGLRAHRPYRVRDALTPTTPARGRGTPRRGPPA